MSTLKKVVLFLLVVGGFLYWYLGAESSNPTYLIAKIEMPKGNRQLDLTIVEKLRPGVSKARSTGLIDGFMKNCPDCRLNPTSTSTNLPEKYERAFGFEVLRTPYFSYEKGGLLPQQDFRIFFDGVTKEEADSVCVEMRKYLKNDFLFFLGGKTACIREAGVL
jgi:hypothetical protein